MPLVREVAEAIKLLGDVVKSTREIIDAVNDGRKFLAATHPEAQQDFSDLFGQMQLAVEGLAEVTKIISGFRFVARTDNENLDIAARELARFNDYVIEQKKDIARLKNNIRKLKADCDKVRVLRDKLDAQTQSRSWGSLFTLFGAKAQQRAHELCSSLSNFYADDQRMIDLLRQTLELAEGGIKEVEDTLGPPGIANPYNVPAAAAVLSSYAVLFDAPQSELHSLADILSETRTALRP